MAYSSRSSVFAFVREVVEGTPVDPLPENFTVVREGASLTGAVNTVTSDELRNSIGASKAFATNQAPTGSIPKYFKPSGIEGVPPDYGILIESSLGADAVVASTEYLTIAGSTPGDADTRAVLNVAAGEEVNFQKGQGILLKDGTNGYAVRNVWTGIAAGALPISFNLETAPGAGVGLGKAVLYKPQDTAQPTYTSHMFQSSNVQSGLHQAIAGSRTTSISAEFVANELAAVTFEIGGLSYYIDPIRIDAGNKFIDFTDDGGVIFAELTEKVYPTPIDLAGEIAAKLTGASVGSGDNVFTVSWSNQTGKFTIATDGTTLELQVTTGVHVLFNATRTLGFTSDKTGGTSYTSDTEQTYEPEVTPEYDSQPPQVVRDNMLLFGTFDDYICVGGQSLTISISTPKTDIPNWCAENGLDESVILSREVTVSGTLKFMKHDVQRFYNLINNIDSQLLFVHGERNAGNWVPGKIVSVFLPTVSLTSNTVADQDGYIVENFEGTAFVGDDLDDVYINFL